MKEEKLIPKKKYGLPILDCKESDRFSSILSLESIVPYYPYMTVKSYEEDYCTIYEIRSWVRIYRDGIWYRVMCMHKYALHEFDLLNEKEVISLLFQQMVITSYKVQILYQVHQQLIKKSSLEIDPLQQDEQLRMMKLIDKNFI